MSVRRHCSRCIQSLIPFLLGFWKRDEDGLLVLIEGRSPEWTDQVRRRFCRTLPNGGKQVIFLPTLSNDRYLRLLLEADVVLDPIHFGGGNSTLEALAMGTPVVTLQGDFLCHALLRLY